MANDKLITVEVLDEYGQKIKDYVDGVMPAVPTNVVQTTGQDTLDVMSQKAVTDELNLKANASNVIEKESDETQTIVANQLTPLALKSNVDNSGYIGFRKADNSIIGAIGFDSGRVTIIEDGTNKTLLKTIAEYDGKVDNYIDAVWPDKDGWRVYHYADKTLECWKTMTFTTGAISTAWGTLKISANYVSSAYPFTLNERIVEDCFIQDNPAGMSLIVIKNTFGNAQVSPQYKVVRPMETATQTISVTLYAKAKVNW